MGLYYHAKSYQSIGNGSRNQNYHVYCIVTDENGDVVTHHLNDVFYGKWSQCQRIINKFYKTANKEKITPATVEVLNKIYNR